MSSITPCQRTISDRFPVASFVVNVPSDRLFEIACATNPRLFRGDHKQHRTPSNFFTSRSSGLMRARAGHATYLLPPEQLRRFAGQQRLYYALGSYRDPRGEGAQLTLDLRQVENAPFIRVSPDFTGRSLDRSRIGRKAVEARYGAANAMLSWGGDSAAATSATAPASTTLPSRAAHDEYDDGYPKDLWRASGGGRRPAGYGYGNGNDPRDPRDPPDIADPGDPEPVGFEDAPELRSQKQGGFQAGTGTYGGRASMAAEPTGYEDAPALMRGAPALMRGPAPMRGAPSLARPSARRSASPTLAAYGSRARPAAAAAAVSNREPPGYEDAPALAGRRRGGGRVNGARYGAADAVAELKNRLASSPGQVGGDFQAAGPFQPPGVDDQYQDDGEGDDTEGEPTGNDTTVYTLPGGPGAAAPLAVADKYRIVMPAVGLIAGPEPYSAINADGEYNDRDHSAYQRVRYGLHWGIAQFNQRSGALGRVLLACQRRDPDRLREIFGPATDELLRITNAPAIEERLQPVEGAFLWQQPWLDRFRQAGEVPAFRAAQNEVAIEGYLDRNLGFAGLLGFDTDRALAMLFDRCVNMGNAGGRRWVVEAISPIVSQGDREQALAALGYPDLQAFQQMVPGLHATGRWGTNTHAALIAALRARGTASPIPIPPLADMLDRMVEAASGRRFETQVAELRDTSDLSDTARLVS